MSEWTVTIGSVLVLVVEYTKNVYTSNQACYNGHSREPLWADVLNIQVKIIRTIH